MATNFTGIDPITADTGVQEAYDVTNYERFRRTMQEAMFMNPVALMQEARQLEESSRPVADMSMTAAEVRKNYPQLNNVPLDRYINRNGTINMTTLNALIARQQRDEAYQMMASSNYSNFTAGVSSFAGAIVGSLADPINIALGLIPVGGVEASLARLGMQGVARGTASTALRAVGVRAMAGAAEDMLINGTLAQPMLGMVRSNLGDDMTAQEYLANVAIGGLIGSGMRVAGGLITDPLGDALSVRYGTGPRNPRTETERKIANMTPEDLDAAGTYKMQAEARGVDANMDAMLNRTASFNATSVTPQERVLSNLGLEMERGRRFRAEDMTFKQTAKSITASIEVEGTRFSARGATQEAATENLNRRIANSLRNKIMPRVNQEGDLFVASYPRDTGKFKDLRGYGTSRDEAIQNLLRVYEQGLSDPKTFVANANRGRAQVAQSLAEVQRVRAAIENGTPIDNLSPEGVGAIAQGYYNRRAGLVQAREALEAEYRDSHSAASRTEKAKLTRQFKKAAAQIDDQLQADTDNVLNQLKQIEDTLSVENAMYTNADTLAFAPEQIASEAALAREVDGLLTNKNSRLEAGVIETKNNGRLAEGVTEDDITMSKYATRVEDRLTASEVFQNMTPDEQAEVIGRFGEAKSDAKILSSEVFDDIVNAYDACERGM